jgi:hypothetical protein
MTPNTAPIPEPLNWRRTSIISVPHLLDELCEPIGHSLTAGESAVESLVRERNRASIERSGVHFVVVAIGIESESLRDQVVFSELVESLIDRLYRHVTALAQCVG